MKVFDCRNEELSAVAALFRVESVKQCRALGTNTIKPELFIDKISELFGAFAETSKLWPKSLSRWRKLEKFSRAKDCGVRPAKTKSKKKSAVLSDNKHERKLKF